MRKNVDKPVVKDLRNWFAGYVRQFDRIDHPDFQRNIDIKRDHSERVVREIIQLGEQLGLDQPELYLAEIIALFHDIGRFEQYERYRTFSDVRSEDHASLGIRILKEHHTLGMLDEEIQELILCAIQYHNRPFLPDMESETCMFYSRLIRDADKLDIWRVVLGYYYRKNGQQNIAIELEKPDTPEISKEVYQALINRQIVYSEHVKNVNDLKLLQAGWIYDINFEPAFRCVRERHYLQDIRDLLPDTKKVREIFEIMDLYIEERERN
jgi:putative nucleotidyltransferase with HDIG domain